MATFPDLDPIKGDYKLPRKAADRKVKNQLAVGWLNAASAFPVGRLSPDLVSRLRRLCTDDQFALHRFRGFHFCELCPPSLNPFSPEPVLAEDGSACYLGSAQVALVTEGQTALCAPNLVYHYVTEHDYLPPRPFIDALASDEFPTNALRRHG